jgi:hypothetical protein
VIDALGCWYHASVISSCALQLTALTVAGAFAASPARAATAPESSDAPADEVRTPSSYETSGPKTAPEQDIKTPPDYEPTRTTGVMAGDIKDPGPLDGTAGPGSVELPPQPTASVDHERVVSSRREPIPPAVPPPTQPTRPTAGDHDADEDRARQDRHRGIAAVAVGGAVAITGFALTGYYGVALKKAGDDLT